MLLSFFSLATLLLATLVSGDCNADDCLRAFRATQVTGHLQAVQSFCSSFASATIPATAIPSYAASACQGNQNGPLSSRISSACRCISTTTTSTPTSTPSATEACALVSSSWAAQKAVAPAATPTVPAQLAHDCLKSVPLAKNAALALADAIEPYLEWQSDSAYKKDPPATYFYPPHDIFAYLASVKTKLLNDKYANEYEFQEDLYQIWARSHDGHFVFYPDLLTKAFEWGRPHALVSISEDGSSIPEIKIYEDVVSSPSTASIVTEINGKDAAKFIADWILQASFNQVPEAAYNSMFYTKAFEGAGTGKGYFYGGGRIRYIYPGSNTTFTFANGTLLALENVAHVKGDFTGVVDGPSFFQHFCNATGGAGPADAAVLADVSTVGAIVPGYPAPVIITNDKIVSGYYLNGTGYDDVAVISLLAFESESFVEFQQLEQQFFADAIRDGKTKLIIDLSANGGGYILQGYDLFRQLFPDIVQDGYSRWRESDTFLAIAEIYSAKSAGFDPSTALNEAISQYESSYNYRYDLNLTDQPFLTFADKFAPHVYKGDNFTNLMRWNLTDPLTTSDPNYGLGTDVTGYNSRSNFTQPFKAENIIMLLDGYCASTCALFAEFMRTQAGVKSVAIGGLPTPGPIQGVGGVKGAETLAWGDVQSSAANAALTANPEQAAILAKLTTLPIQRSSSSALNVRDNILPDHVSDGLPAQYVVEYSDCRLYYTEPMVTDVTELWKAAADAAFNGKACAAGSLPKRDIEADLKEQSESWASRERRAAGVRRSVSTVDPAFVKAHGNFKAIP